MTTTFYPGSLQWLGLAKETVSGTAQAAPTMWIPVKSPKWTPTVTPLTDDGMRGMMGTDYGLQQGMRHDTLSYDCYLYPSLIFPHLMAILGGTDTVTGTVAPYTHSISLYNGSGTDNAQPPSYTGFLAMGDKTVQIPGMRASEMKIDIKADALPTLSASWDGMAGSFITNPVNTPSTDTPMPSWTATTTVGGVALSTASDVSLDYKRDTKPIIVLSGVQSPIEISAGALTATGSITAVWQGTTGTYMVDMLANTQPSFVLALNPAGDSTHSLTLQHTKVAYTKAEPSGGSSGWMELATDFTALMNATDGSATSMSPFKAVLVSTQQTAY